MAHAEGLQPPKDYSVLSPLQRKEELIAFYRALPRPDDGDTYESDVDGLTAKGIADMFRGIVRGYVRRGKSDYHLRLMLNLNELLKQCSSTPTFRDYVLSVFGQASIYEVLGRDIYSEVDDNQLAPLLDLDRPESAGIFDSVRVKEIEREVYREHLKNQLVRMRKGRVEADIRSQGAK